MTHNPYAAPKTAPRESGRHPCGSKPSPLLAVLANWPLKCPDCGQFVKIPGLLQALGTVFSLGCLGLAIAMAIQYRSWLPYVGCVALVGLLQYWLGWRAPRVVVVPKPLRLSVVAYFVLAMFFCLLVYFAE